MIAGRTFNVSLLLWDWHNYELDFQLVLDLHNATRDAGWMNAKISLFDCRTARVGSFRIVHVRPDGSALTVECQLTGDKPVVDCGLFDLRRMKADKRIAFALQDLGMHGMLNFRLLLRAQFAVFDQHELAGVNGKGYLREIAVIEAAFGKRCGYPMIVTRGGEQTCLTHVNLQDAMVGIDPSIDAHQPQRCCENKPCHPDG